MHSVLTECHQILKQTYDAANYSEYLIRNTQGIFDSTGSGRVHVSLVQRGVQYNVNVVENTALIFEKVGEIFWEKNEDLR